MEIGFCPEFGSCKSPKVRRWKSEVRVQAHDFYSQADIRELDSIISELSELTNLKIRRVQDNSANINIYFVAQRDFKKRLPNYNLANPQEGVFATRYDSSDRYIVSGAICIDNVVTGVKRRHLLREELTQVLGLQNDSNAYQNSIFQQDPQYTPTAYSDTDKEVIRLLYDPKVKPGMSRQQVKTAMTVQKSETLVAGGGGGHSPDKAGITGDMRQEQVAGEGLEPPTRGL